MNFRLSAIAFFLALSWAAPVSANMAQPWRVGAIGAEPEGIDDVHVTHEELVFDLRDDAGDRAERDRVTATYSLQNDGSAQALDLQFVAVGMTADAPFTIEVNGQAVERRFVKEHPIPSSWTYPRETPLPGGGSTGLATPEPRDNVAPSIVFTAELEAGANEIEVAYELQPSATTVGRSWAQQTAYVLSPAKSWASFGTLRIEVIVPDDVEVATSLELERVDGALEGEFEGLPADTFTVTTQPKIPFGSIGIFYLLTIGGVLLIAWLGTFVGVRRLFTRTDSATKAALAGAVATVVAVPVGVVALWLSEFLLPPAGPEVGYLLLFFGTPAVIAVAVFAGLITTAILWWRGSTASP